MKDWTHIYFIGIGGIGMSALARWYRHQGKSVAGYDRVSTPLAKELESEGINIRYQDDWESIPEEFKNPSTTLVVITPAVPKSHIEWTNFQSLGFTILKRSEVLGLISEEYFTIAVAGTHGKTSTSSIITYLLDKLDQSFVAFLGGIAKNYDSNFIIKEGKGEKIAVIEADEYDRSFLKLSPNIAVITAIEADHLDIYGSEAQLKETFTQFGDQAAANGSLICHQSVEISSGRHTYGLDGGDYQLQAGAVENGKTAFSFTDKHQEKLTGTASLFGNFNMENLCAALSVVSVLQPEKIATLGDLTGYQAVRRRMEKHYEDQEVVYIDDYAHHPTEIRALIEAVKLAYAGYDIHAIFQPHLFSRTKDFHLGFAQSLDLADNVCILPIYPAREEPLPGVTSQMILDQMAISRKKMIGKSDVKQYIKEIKKGVLLTIGAGDIDQCIDEIIEILKERR